MALNPYFNNYGHDRSQRLIESVIIESIKIYGYDVCYIPRTIQNMDLVFGEDPASKFEQFAVVEVYIKNTEGFAGQGRFASKFGIEVRDQVTFSLARRRFEQIKTEKLLAENSWNLQLESANLTKPGESQALELEDGNTDDLSITFDRPREGDLIYFPLANKLFEIKYVNYETIFYQLGNLQLYDLECELFEFSNEQFNTGDVTIDNIGNLFGSNLQDNDILTEDDEVLQQEEFDNTITQDVNLPEDADKQANNSVFYQESNDVVDFSETNPLIKSRRW